MPPHAHPSSRHGHTSHTLSCRLFCLCAAAVATADSLQLLTLHPAGTAGVGGPVGAPVTNRATVNTLCGYTIIYMPALPLASGPAAQALPLPPRGCGIPSGPTHAPLRLFLSALALCTCNLPCRSPLHCQGTIASCGLHRTRTSWSLERERSVANSTATHTAHVNALSTMCRNTLSHCWSGHSAPPRTVRSSLVLISGTGCGRVEWMLPHYAAPRAPAAIASRSLCSCSVSSSLRACTVDT